MTPEEIKSALAGLEATKNAMKEAVDKLPALEKAIGDTKAFKKEFEAAQTQLKGFESQMEIVVTDIKQISDKLSQKEVQESNGNPTLAAIKENAAEIAKAVEKSIQSHKFEVKANVTRASVTNSTDALRLTDIGQLATRQLRLYDLFAKVPVGKGSNGTVRYSDWDSGTAARAAAAIAEGAAFPESTAAWAEYTLTIQKIGDSIPVTEEMVTDQPRFAAELDQFIATNIDLKVDSDLLSGNGTSPNIKGLYTYATTYTAVASGITAANQYDLIVKIVETMTNGKNGKYKPNFVLMNMTDINKMRQKKDTTNNYLVPPFADINAAGDSINVAGLTVIECGALTANTMVVGDSRFAKIYEIEGYQAEVGYVNDQFAKDLMTMKARKRLALLVRTADTGAFYKCTDIAAALTTLAT